MTPRKPWYSHLTLDHLIKYFTLAMFITGMITGIGRVIAVPYIKDQITVGIENNNEKFLKVIEDKYADKNTTLKDIYNLQMDTYNKMSDLQAKVARIEGRINK